MFVEGLKDVLKYKPADEEKRQGLDSSIGSPGATGRVNRFLARVFGQGEADVVGFLNHWRGVRQDIPLLIKGIRSKKPS